MGSCLILGLVCSQVTWALPEDEKEPATMAANTADINQLSHKGVYTGDVQYDQGTRHLRADKAVTLSDDKNKLIFANVFGTVQEPAHYWELTAKEKPLMHAYANEIKYYPKKNRIEFIGNAKIMQGDDSFSAPKIIFNTVSQHVITEKKGQERTVIIIHPGKKNDGTGSA